MIEIAIIGPLAIGMIIRKKMTKSFAPSTFAASTYVQDKFLKNE